MLLSAAAVLAVVGLVIAGTFFASQPGAAHRSHDVLVKGIFRIVGGPPGNGPENLSGRIDFVLGRTHVETLAKPATVYGTRAVSGRWSIAVPPGTYRVCAFTSPRGGDAVCPFDKLLVVPAGRALGPIPLVLQIP